MRESEGGKEVRENKWQIDQNEGIRGGKEVRKDRGQIRLRESEGGRK